MNYSISLGGEKMKVSYSLFPCPVISGKNVLTEQEIKQNQINLSWKNKQTEKMKYVNQ